MIAPMISLICVSDNIDTFILSAKCWKHTLVRLLVILARVFEYLSSTISVCQLIERIKYLRLCNYVRIERNVCTSEITNAMYI